jgi:D-alanyl-D-alanine carboxypeptidase
VVVVTTGLVLSSRPRLSTLALPFFINIKSVIAREAYPPIPVYRGQTPFAVGSEAVFVMDLDSEVVLLAKNENVSMLPASTVKMMTALVAADVYNTDSLLEVKNPMVVGQKMGLKPGEKITVNNLLNGLLIYSANDAAEVLAQNYSEGRQVFVSLMNQKAKNLGLTNTHFTNPSGIDENGQYTTARDLVYLGFGILENAKVSEIVATKRKTVASVDGLIQHRLVSTNELLGEVPGVLGIKTGWTEYARENLVTYINRDNHRVVIAVLGSRDRFGETRSIIDWVFSSFVWQPVTDFL